MMPMDIPVPIAVSLPVAPAGTEHPIIALRREDLSASDRRVLAHLAGPDHRGRTDLAEGMVSLIGKRGGISLVLAQVPMGQMDALVQSGHVVRSGQGDRLIYRLADHAPSSRSGRGDRTGDPARVPASIAVVGRGAEQGRTSGKPEMTAIPVAIRKRGQDNPLVWLACRKDKAGQALISPTALAAGERLQRDFLQAGMSPKMTSDWSGLPTGGEGRKSGHLLQAESQIAARQRLRRALAACGEDYANLLLDLCCFNTPLELVEKRRGWPARSGKVVLGMALAALMRHYGLSEMARGRSPKGANRQRLHVWRAPESGAPDGRSGLGERLRGIATDALDH